MSRTRLNLNREWTFHRSDVPSAELPELDDSGWERIGLPHTFDLPYFRTPEFFVGVGWYRKRFDALPGWRGKRLHLEFDGAFQVAEVYLNGVRVGAHEGGYTGFCFDVTAAAREGENVLAVRVNNEWNARIAPRAGEHIFSGGLYRDVHLTVTDPVHVTWCGTRITTPRVAKHAATVAVSVEVANASDGDVGCVVRTSVLAPDGSEACKAESPHRLTPGATVDVDHALEIDAAPLLWHTDHPHLYKARVEVLVAGQCVDRTDTPFGIRWFEWTADQGFFLNGKHLYLRGANAHQDHAGWGIGITRAACERDVRLIKEAGFNFVRGAHYPHHPAFAEACDRLGVLFWSENAFWGKGGFGPEGYWNASAFPADREDFAPFGESCKQQLREMIRINRNSPSIIAWSMTNEAFFTYNLDDAKQLMRELVELTQELDPTRPAAIGGAQRGDVDRIGDIAGYNGDGARLFIDPGVPNMVSEYGAISKPHDAYEPFYGEKQVEQFPWRAGEAIWCAFDYGSIAGRQGLKGICDHARMPKRSWYWYRNELRGIAPPPFPAPGAAARLELSADKTTILGTDATDDVQLAVTVQDKEGRHVSNCPPVTLTIESGPGEFPTGRSITIAPEGDIRIVEGAAAIAFRSYHAGESIIRAISPGLVDASITIMTTGSPAWQENGSSVVTARPYVPPPESEAARWAMRNAVNVALNRPSRASSEAERHPARFANDGAHATAWVSAEPLGSWTCDLEGYYQLASLRLTLAEEANFRFIVELSSDGSSWMSAIDRSNTENTRLVRNDVFPPGAVARYVCVRFVDVPAGRRANLAEVEVQGVLSVR